MLKLSISVCVHEKEKPMKTLNSHHVATLLHSEALCRSFSLLLLLELLLLNSLDLLLLLLLLLLEKLLLLLLPLLLS